MNTPSWTACLLGAILCHGAAVFTQPSARLSGSVIDATGLPLAGATATLRAPAAVTETDAAGRFAFPNLSNGQHELTVSLQGFATARRVIHVASGGESVVSVALTLLILERAVVTASRTGETDVQATPMAVTVLPADRLARMQDQPSSTSPAGRRESRSRRTPGSPRSRSAASAPMPCSRDPRIAVVELAKSDTQITLRITDDRVGFLTGGRAGSGLGLRSVDERVRLVHGHVDVTSRPGQGTTLHVRIPSPPAAVAHAREA